MHIVQTFDIYPASRGYGYSFRLLRPQVGLRAGDAVEIFFGTEGQLLVQGRDDAHPVAEVDLGALKPVGVEAEILLAEISGAADYVIAA